MITPEALTAFAAEQVNMKLDRATAERLSRLYTAYIRAQLATLKQQEFNDDPPFRIAQWREMSATKRLLFGTVTDNRRTTGVVRLANHMSGVLHKRKGRPGYFAFFFPSDLWSAAVLEDDKRRAQLEKLWNSRDTNLSGAVPIAEGRLRSSLPAAKKSWFGKRFGIDLANTEWPILPADRAPVWSMLEGAELADILVLFGLYDRSSAYQQKLAVMIRTNPETKTVSLNNTQLWVTLTSSAL